MKAHKLAHDTFNWYASPQFIDHRHAIVQIDIRPHLNTQLAAPTRHFSFVAQFILIVISKYSKKTYVPLLISDQFHAQFPNRGNLMGKTRFGIWSVFAVLFIGQLTTEQKRSHRFIVRFNGAISLFLLHGDNKQIILSLRSYRRTKSNAHFLWGHFDLDYLKIISNLPSARRDIETHSRMSVE